jgi:MoaA/NifB/PqqE/SkfB family radical SAM enzyme
MTGAPWPRHVLLEVTNACDLACRHCHFHGEGVVKTREVGMMATSVWRAAIEEAASWGTELTLQPWGMGEPLLHPELWQLVAAAKLHPHLAVGFYSNGMQWDAAAIDRAITSRLDWVCFSVDGLDAEQFAKYRKNGDLARVTTAIESLVGTRNARGATHPRVRINMVAYEDATTTAEAFVARWRGLADSVNISRFRPIGSRRFSPIELPRVPCYQLDTILAVAWSGEVAMCCEDPQVSAPVGRFPDQTLASIWNGERLRELRAAHRSGNYAAARLCVDCDAWTGIYGRDGRAPGLLVEQRTAATIYTFADGDGNGAEPSSR